MLQTHSRLFLTLLVFFLIGGTAFAHNAIKQHQEERASQIQNSSHDSNSSDTSLPVTTVQSPQVSNATTTITPSQQPTTPAKSISPQTSTNYPQSSCSWKVQADNIYDSTSSSIISQTETAVKAVQDSYSAGWSTYQQEAEAINEAYTSANTTLSQTYSSYVQMLQGCPASFSATIPS